MVISILDSWKRKRRNNMAIKILDSWNEPDANFATVKTSEGTFTIYRRQIHYSIVPDLEQFTVMPCRLNQKIVDIYWPVGKNPMDISKYLERFRNDLSKIKDLTGVDPFELMEIVKEKEEK